MGLYDIELNTASNFLKRGLMADSVEISRHQFSDQVDVLASWRIPMDLLVSCRDPSEALAQRILGKFDAHQSFKLMERGGISSELSGLHIHLSNSSDETRFVKIAVDCKEIPKSWGEDIISPTDYNKSLARIVELEELLKIHFRLPTDLRHLVEKFNLVV